MIGNNLCDKKFAKNFEIKYFNIGKKAKDFKSILQIGNGFFK